MEVGKFKLQYFSRKARYLHSVKSNTPAIGTFMSTLHTKKTPDPPYCLNNRFWKRCSKLNFLTLNTLD